MNDENLYQQIREQLPALEIARILYHAEPPDWQSIIVAVYRQGRVDQLEEWVGKVKTEKGE